jgi:hypothetical protein
VKRAFSFTVLGIVLVACGGAAKSVPEAESAPASPSKNADAPSGYAPGPPPPAPPPQQAQPGAGATTREGMLGKARSDFDGAQRELDVAAGDCVAACRALGSMDRATAHLCGMAQQQDERARCEEAKTKVRGARDKVRTTCGSCPGGPTVDKNAPIPSAP